MRQQGMICSIVVLSLTAATYADLDVTGWGLAPGQKFHILYQTTDTVAAHSPAVSVYDAQVNTWADGYGAIYGIDEGDFFSEIDFFALLSTPDASAAGRFGNITVPIYNTQGQMIAANGQDLFTPGLHSVDILNELGVLTTYADFTWTGSTELGDAYPPFEVGGSSSFNRTGNSARNHNNLGTAWIFYGSQYALHGNYKYSLYSMSQEVTSAAQGAANASPTVTNVLASQRTDDSGIVDVTYTLADADNDACEITVVFSDNGGSTWAITPSSGALSGDVGSSVTPGSKHLVWASKMDVPGTYHTNFGVQITADDEITEHTVTVASTTGGSTDHDGSHSVVDGATITITPTANSGYHFTGWSGDASGSENPLIMTVTSHLDITANFAVDIPPLVDTDFLVHAQMQIDTQGTTTFYTGFDVSLWDDDLYAYNQGVRSAIITGPGLPATGQILEHYYPEPDLRLYPKGQWGHPSGGWGLWLDDTTILTIPDNAVYTIGLYQEVASEVSLSDTPLQSYTNTIAKPPVLNSELDASLFPTLITPSSHDESVLNIPGLMEVSWTSPPHIEVDYMNLGLHQPNGTGYMVSTDVELGDTSATLDTTGLPPDVRANQLYMTGLDSYDRNFGIGWELD